MDLDLEVLILIPAALHSAARAAERELEVTVWWSQQDHIIRKKQWPNRTPSTPWLRLEILSIKFEQDRWQRAALAESKPHWKQVWLIPGNADQALTPVIQGTDSPYQGVRYPVLPENPPQGSPRDTVECLLQVHKTHVNWLGKLPCTLKDPAEGVELVHCSTTWTKTTLLLLNLRLDYPTDPPFQHPRIDLTRKAEECDPPTVGTHPPVPLLKKRDHHFSLPIQRHCPRCPRDAAESCQPWQPHNIQGLKELRVDLIHPRGPATRVPRLLPYWKACRWDWGGLRSIPSTDPQHPESRSAAHHGVCYGQSVASTEVQ